jgi:hypothetical protein
MSASAAARWQSICDRLGVKPRQFAVLLTVTAVAVGALAAKSALKPSRAKAAAPAAAPARQPSKEAPSAAPAAGGLARTVELVLEAKPARDPFRPFFLVADAAPAQAASAVGRPGAPGPSAAAPAGLPLRAIIAGEYAVIGEHTVGVGDEVVDGDGRRFVVEEILERRVVLREGSRRAELGYAAPRPQAAQRGARK